MDVNVAELNALTYDVTINTTATHVTLVDSDATRSAKTRVEVKNSGLTRLFLFADNTSNTAVTWPSTVPQRGRILLPNEVSVYDYPFVTKYIHALSESGSGKLTVCLDEGI